VPELIVEINHVPCIRRFVGISCSHEDTFAVDVTRSERHAFLFSLFLCPSVCLYEKQRNGPTFTNPLFISRQNLRLLTPLLKKTPFPLI